MEDTSTPSVSLTVHLPLVSAELLDGLLLFPSRHKSQWHDARNVHIWPICVHIQFELLTDCLDVLETFLVIRTCTADPDLDFVLKETCRDGAESADDTFECGCNLCSHVSYFFKYD